MHVKYLAYMANIVMYGILGASFFSVFLVVSLMCLLAIFSSRGYLPIISKIFLFFYYLLLAHLKSILPYTTIDL